MKRSVQSILLTSAWAGSERAAFSRSRGLTGWAMSSSQPQNKDVSLKVLKSLPVPPSMFLCVLVFRRIILIRLIDWIALKYVKVTSY